MSNIINVVQKTITSSSTIEVLQTEFITIDLSKQVIIASISLVDSDNNTVVDVKQVSLSGSDFSNIFNLSAFNSAVAAALEYTKA